VPTLEQFLNFPKYLQQLRSLAPWLLIVVSLLLLNPFGLTTLLKIDTLIEQYRPYIAVIFVGCLADIMCRLWSAITKRIDSWRDKQLEIELFGELTTEELWVIAMYVLLNTTCLPFHRRDGIIAGLIRKNFLDYECLAENSISEVTIYIKPSAKKLFLANKEALLARLPRDETGQFIPYKSRGR
jgi:Super-infection exclusion protein B